MASNNVYIAYIILQEKHSKAIMEGWEYASLGSSSFHIPAGCFDLVRRRRYVRKLIRVEQGAGRAVFKPSSAKTKKGDKKKKKEDGEDHDECEGKQLVPRMYLHFKGIAAMVVAVCSCMHGYIS